MPSSGVLFFDVADDGTLVYAERDPGANRLELAWLARSGSLESLGLPPREYQMPKVSPDGKRLAVAIGPSGGRSGDVWIHDLASGALTKLSFEGRSWTPIWSRDGHDVTYSTMLPSGADQFRTRSADGGEEPRTQLAFEDGLARQPVAWTADGSLARLGGCRKPRSRQRHLLSARGAKVPLPIASTNAIESQAALSPDGRFIAYISDASGNSEVYVQPFPPTGAKWQVANSGTMPLWAPDGRELFYLKGRNLMVVPVLSSSTFSIGAPRKLIEMPASVLLATDTTTNFDIAPDGRFLVVRQTSQENMTGHLVVALDWFETLRKLAPLQSAR